MYRELVTPELLRRNRPRVEVDREQLGGGGELRDVGVRRSCAQRLTARDSEQRAACDEGEAALGAAGQEGSAGRLHVLLLLGRRSLLVRARRQDRFVTVGSVGTIRVGPARCPSRESPESGGGRSCSSAGTPPASSTSSAASGWTTRGPSGSARSRASTTSPSPCTPRSSPSRGTPTSGRRSRRSARSTAAPASPPPVAPSSSSSIPASGSAASASRRWTTSSPGWARYASDSKRRSARFRSGSR